MDKEKIEVDFRNLIKCALNDKIPWPVLKTFLDNMTTTLEKSKKVIDVLFEELQALNSKQITALEQDNHDLNLKSQSTVLDQEHRSDSYDAIAVQSDDNLQDIQLEDGIKLEQEMGETNFDWKLIQDLNEEHLDSLNVMENSHEFEKLFQEGMEFQSVAIHEEKCNETDGDEESFENEEFNDKLEIEKEEEYSAQDEPV